MHPCQPWRGSCRSAVWRSFTRRAVIPWALEGLDLCDEPRTRLWSGTVAAELLSRFRRLV